MAMIMAARNGIRPRLARVCALAGAAVLCALSIPAWAEVRVVEAGPGTLVVEARDATVEQILEALSKSRNFEFHTARALNRVLSGTYSGTLPRVLSRILDGYDHVVRSTPSGIRLSVVGVAGPARPSVTQFLAAAPTVVSGTVPMNIGNRVSSNVDLDEENAAMAGAVPVKAAPPSRSVATPRPPVPAASTGNTRGPAGVDPDEETSR
jgi:hypothetical protein